MSVERMQQRYEHRYFGQTAGEFTRQLQTALRHDLGAQRQAGYPIYGVDESEGVYTLLPDGRRLVGGPLPPGPAPLPLARCDRRRRHSSPSSPVPTAPASQPSHACSSRQQRCRCSIPMLVLASLMLTIPPA